MPSSRHQVKTYLDNDEKARVDQLADQLHLSTSELLRRLVLGQRLPQASDFAAWQGIRDLLKVNADLARLGNLFKLALDEAPAEELMGRLDSLATEITQTQKDLKDCVRQIRAAVQPPRP